jgi:hypothetical protein
MSEMMSVMSYRTESGIEGCDDVGPAAATTAAGDGGEDSNRSTAFIFLAEDLAMANEDIFAGVVLEALLFPLPLARVRSIFPGAENLRG